MPLQEVKPGDLITAEDFNLLFQQLQDLEERVAHLEGGSNLPPVITKIEPEGEVRLLQQIEVHGENFTLPVVTNTVKIGGVPVAGFNPGSDETKLVLNVPATIVGVPKQTFLTVENDNGDDSFPISLLPSLVLPQGIIVVTNITGDLGEIEVGEQYTLQFRVDSQTNMPESYQLQVNYANIQGSATSSQWLAATSLLPATGNTPITAPVLISPGSPITVRVRVTIPQNAESTDISLRAQSVNNPTVLTTSSGAVKLEVGEEPEVSDPKTTFVLPTFGPFAKARRATINGQEGIEIAYNNSSLVSIGAAFTIPGSYSYTASLEPDDGEWVLTPETIPSSVEVAGGDQALGLTLQLNTGAAAGHPELRMLRVTATRTTTGDTAGTFTSFIRIPVQGFTPAQ